MNEIEKPEKCSEHDCNNKAYAKDKITKDQWRWVCKKHHFQFAYGIDYPRETVRGGIKVKKEPLPKTVHYLVNNHFLCNKYLNIHSNAWTVHEENVTCKNCKRQLDIVSKLSGVKTEPIIVIGGIGQSGKELADRQEKINNLIRKPHKRDLATFPHLKLGERIYWQVGCINCGKGDKYKVHYDGANGLAIQCECGRITRWENAKLQGNPDSYPNYFHPPKMTTHFST